MIVCKSFRYTLALLFLFTFSALATTIKPDFEKLREAREKFQADESARKEAAAKKFLFHAATKMNANQSDYDVNYYGIHVNLNFSNSSIIAAIDYQFTSMVPSLTTIDLNLHDQLDVDSVLYGGQQVLFTHVAAILSITLPAPLNTGQQAMMTVYYHGFPVHNGGYANGGMAFANHFGNLVCWTSTEPFYSRNWWPCKDTPSDKADSLELWIECPSNMFAASNGSLLETISAGAGRSIYHWKHRYPITTYLVAMSVADFDIRTKNWSYGGHNMPVYAYNFPGAWSTITCYDTLTIPVLNNFSDAFGIYPFVNEKLGNADCGVWGTMEHQSCSFHDPYSGYDKEYLVIHENAHQWWGDMITCRTFHDIWLNEGFGTWSEAIFYERQFGSHEVYLDYMRGLKQIGAGSVYVENPETQDIFDVSTSYYKGASVVHMLRGVLGEADFFDFIQDWAASSFRYGSASTADISSFCSNWVGSDMSWFFNQWIFQPGNPDYEYSWLCQPDPQRAGYKFYLRVSQLQTHLNVYKMPVRVSIHTTGGIIDTSVWNDQRDQVFEFDFPDLVTSVEFDPDEWILRTATEVPMTAFVPRNCPDAEVGEPYYYELPVIGGTSPYSWTFLGGDIPFGMTYSDGPSFILSGTPTYAATYYLSVRVTDSSNPPLVIEPSLTINVLQPSTLCGDADDNGQVTISDAVFLINYIFGGGPAPELEAGDVDCSGQLSISDAVYLINYIFGGGASPCAACD